MAMGSAMLGAAEPGGLPGGEPPVSPVAAASWRTAEDQLFGPLANQPDLCRVVVVLVGDTLARLRRLGPSTAALNDAALTVTALVRDVQEQGGLAAHGIDPELVGRAALALRLREVVAEQATTRRLELLAAARAEQLPWVVLEESGDPAGDPWDPYRRLEAQTATGRVLLVRAVPDDDFRTCQHTVELLQLDLDTGRLEPPPGPDEAPFRCSIAADREAHVGALRRTLPLSG
jgi:hypothetical protein